MANSAQSKKRARQAEDSRQRNAGQRSAMRTIIKALKNAIEAGDKELATKEFATATPILDRYASKGLIHKNKAARSKSRLSAKINAL